MPAKAGIHGCRKRLAFAMGPRVKPEDSEEKVMADGRVT
jgi:hypothetical protein